MGWPLELKFKKNTTITAPPPQGTIPLSHPVFLLGIQLRHLLLQSFAGPLNILRGPTDTHKVAVLRWRRDGDVDVVVLHHLAHVLALAANDEAVVVKGHLNLFCYGHQFLRGGRENGYMFTLWKKSKHLVRENINKTKSVLQMS